MPSRDLPIPAPACPNVPADLSRRSTCPLSVTVPAVMLLNVADGARAAFIAIFLILVVPSLVTAIQQAAATFVALFASDERRAERALRVLRTLQSRPAPSGSLKGRRRGSRRRRGGRGR
jgi:hypothetical protein